jgi:T5SS/PEP-CTERM-associated repeat protein/autotransporter-associated beta strand protein
MMDGPPVRLMNEFSSCKRWIDGRAKYSGKMIAPQSPLKRLPSSLAASALRIALVSLPIVAACYFFGCRAYAQTVWIDANGDWFDAANWSAGVPDLTTDAQVNNGGIARIDLGRAASAQTMGLGFNSSDSGNLLLDRGSSLATNVIAVGQMGRGTLNIANGSTLLDITGSVGNGEGSTGMATVNGVGSSWTHLDSLSVGENGNGTLNITRGGVVSAPRAVVGDGFFGNHPNASGTVFVEGAASSLNIVTRLIIGELGTGTLRITDGGLVSDREGSVADLSSSFGMVIVDGTGSRWINSERLTIGGNGNGMLSITHGATVSDTSGSIGTGALGFNFGTKGAVIVDGAGSTWTNTSTLAVGEFGTGTLTISNGGAVSSHMTGLIGYDSGALGIVTVDGAGSIWNNDGDLFFGSKGTGILNITRGGAVSSANTSLGGAFLFFQADASGGATVDGPGSIWTNTGQLFVGDFSAGTLQITNGGSVSNTNGFIGFAGLASGTVIVDGSGSTWTNSGNLYVGGNTVRAAGVGLLRIQNGGVVKAATTTVWSTGTLEIGINPNLTGTLRFDNGGTLRTIAATTFSNSATLTGTGVRVDSGIFISTLSGIFEGTGGLTKSGAGTIVFTNASTYSGDTHVEGGSLIVDGSITSPNSFVNSAALLGGTGTIGGNVASSGVVSPGNSGPGKLTLNGSYTQSNTGTLEIEIGGLASVQHDLLRTDGTAQLNGVLQLARLNNFHFVPGDKVTFLTAAGGVAGTFSTVTNPFNDTIILTDVVYEANQVSLESFQGSFASLSGLSRNQRAVAKNLDLIVTDPRESELIAFLDTELLGKLRHDYDLIAPEELASIYEIGFSQVTVQNLNLQRRMEEIRAGSTGFSASGFNMHGDGRDNSDGKTSIYNTSSEKPAPLFNPSPENRWGMFVTGSGEFVSTGNEDANARGYDITTGGVTLGLDFRPAPHFVFGVNTGYAHSSADLVEKGRVTVEAAKIGAYATYFSGGFYLDTAVGAGWNSYDTLRAALRGDTRGRTDGAEFNALIGTGYDWKKGNWSFGPIASFQYSNIGINAFTEGRSLGSLEIQEQNEDRLRSMLGMKASYDWKTCGVIVRPDMRVGWQHEYRDPSYPIDARFASEAGNVFTVRGPAVSRDKAVFGVGLSVQWSSRVLTDLYYQGEAGSNYTFHSIGGGVSVNF